METTRSTVRSSQPLHATRRARGRQPGSALLVALIIMGILLTLALGVSDLVLSTLRDSRFLLEKTKAWYAAESGIEHALDEIAANAPGYENAEEFDDSALKYAYRIAATGERYPNIEPFDEKAYASLGVNESVTIPLFRGKEPGEAARELRVEFYLAPDLALSNEFVDSDLDILRWKIFGLKDGKMEVINEFVPMMPGRVTANNPSCLGTDSDCWNGAKFYQWNPPEGFHIIEKHPIATFLEQHNQNFLVLTNIVNVDTISGSLSVEQKQKIAAIRYRIIEGEGKPNLTLPVIQVESTGSSGEAVERIKLEVKRESFLPVFNYALYRTDTGR